MKRISLVILFFISFLTCFSQTPDELNEKKLNFNSIGDKTYIDSTYAENFQSDTISEKLIINSNWWHAVLAIIIFSFFVWIYYNYNNELNFSLKSMFSSVFFRQVQNIQSSVFNNFVIFLNIIFFVVFSLALFYFLNSNKSVSNLDISDLELYLFILLFIVGFYFIKLITAKIWTFIFDGKNFFKVYSISIKLANILASILLIFVVFIAIFNPFCNNFCLFTSFFIVVSVFILRLWRMLTDFFQQGFSFFYLILYLCTVEILPVLVVLKYFSII